MKRYTNGFIKRLVGLDFETLEKSQYSIYGLDRNLNFNYFNPAWVSFANENDNSNKVLTEFPLGTHFANALSGNEVKEFYIKNYEQVLKTGEVWWHQYECSSCVEYRKFNLGAYPLKNGQGLIITNTLVKKLPMKNTNRTNQQAFKTKYTQPSGFIVQCSNCRHTQQAENPEVWDWVPAWIKNNPEKCSHSICPICFDYHWKHLKRN